MTKLEKILKKQDNPKKHAQVHDLKEYFKLPKEQREKFGFWYLKPYALPGLFNDEEDKTIGWAAFSREIRKQYPVQGWFREWCFDFDNPVYAFCSIKQARLKDNWYTFKCFFNPKHKMIRKAIPRTWRDISTLIVDVNFAMIHDFFHNEATNGYVDWQSQDLHKKFYIWLVAAVKYIDIDRKNLIKQREAAYPENVDHKMSYEELYKDVIRLEAELEAADEKILKEMIEFRKYFWT